MAGAVLYWAWTVAIEMNISWESINHGVQNWSLGWVYHFDGGNGFLYILINNSNEHGSLLDWIVF